MTDGPLRSNLLSTAAPMTRRRAMAGTAAFLAATGARWAAAQDGQGEEGEEVKPFTFEWLADRMRRASQEAYQPPQSVDGVFGNLDYDSYRLIQFDPAHARWSEEGSGFVLHAHPMGWLFDTPVALNEIVDGKAHRLTFNTNDFIYYGNLDERIPDDTPLPGVAGFRLNAPLNRNDRLDEVVSFLGASYFRALGRNNLYGLSARGLAVNTATDWEEEFPAFREFWLERPAPGADQVVVYAALDSELVAGAYRFVIIPGEITRIDVTARLFFRRDVRQLGVAPLTSMFLFGPNDPGDFHDYRHSVHDSEALLVNSGGQSFYRPLNNPPRLANSYLTSDGPSSFGLVQRSRDFDDYLDAHARYERRPSLMVEPVGNWGRGTIRLIEIPSELEANDNVVAYWVPEGQVRGGDELEFNYRLHWGSRPPGSQPRYARVLRTLVGHGGVAGAPAGSERQKFVVDFVGASLAELSEDTEVTPRVTASNGEIAETTLERIGDGGLWRLVIEAGAASGAVVEIRADLYEGDTRLTETWLYQWVKE